MLAFMPETLKKYINDETGKSYTPNEVLEMSNIDQLDLIKTFYKSWFDEMNVKEDISPGDFSSITFYPETIRKDWKWKFPEYVIDKNIEMFKKFEGE